MTRHPLAFESLKKPVSPADRAVDTAGCWRLGPGRAVSLYPREGGELTLAQGRVWVTLGISVAAPGAMADMVLCAGERLALRAGQHVVMEDWPVTPAQGRVPAGTPQGAAFSWRVDMAQPRSATGINAATAVAWEGSVRRPLQELAAALRDSRRAAGVAASAIARLAKGLVHVAECALRAAGRQGGGLAARCAMR
jgi:hypothetical protein